MSRQLRVIKDSHGQERLTASRTSSFDKPSSLLTYVCTASCVRRPVRACADLSISCTEPRRRSRITQQYSRKPHSARFGLKVLSGRVWGKACCCSPGWTGCKLALHCVLSFSCQNFIEPCVDSLQAFHSCDHGQTPKVPPGKFVWRKQALAQTVRQTSMAAASMPRCCDQYRLTEPPCPAGRKHDG